MPENVRATTTIKGIGKQQRSDGWMLTLDHKLGNSQYDTVLYGNNWDQLEGWSIGKRCQIEIQKGNLKKDKDAQYDSSYFWNLVSINPPGQQPDVDNPPSFFEEPETDHGEPPPRQDDVQTRIERGVAYNTAKEIAFAHPESMPDPMESIADWHHAVRQLRDEIYHTGDIQTTIAPLHYCYVHDRPRSFSEKTQQWGHLNPPDRPCMEYAPEEPESPVRPPVVEPGAEDGPQHWPQQPTAGLEAPDTALGWEERQRQEAENQTAF